VTEASGQTPIRRVERPEPAACAFLVSGEAGDVGDAGDVTGQVIAQTETVSLSLR
jgi:hypothetical protein